VGRESAHEDLQKKKWEVYIWRMGADGLELPPKGKSYRAGVYSECVEKIEGTREG